MMKLVPENMLSRVVSLDFFGTSGSCRPGRLSPRGSHVLASPRAIIASGAIVSALIVSTVMTRPWLREAD